MAFNWPEYLKSIIPYYESQSNVQIISGLAHLIKIYINGFNVTTLLSKHSFFVSFC